MASEDVQTNLRLPADLKDRLVASASNSKRSLSAEVSARLEGSFHESGLKLSNPARQAVQKLVDRAGITDQEALERLVLQGHATLENRNVLVIRADASLSMDDLIRVLSAAKNFLPDISDVHLERD